MTAKCPRCFRSLSPDLYAWECAAQCRPASDPIASANAGAAIFSKPIIKTQKPSNVRRWTPPTTLACPSCRGQTRAVCPECHFALLPGWRSASTLCIALAGARATGKSIYLAVLVKQLEQMLNQAGQALTFADEISRRIYEEHYERHLYEARGIMGSTPKVGTGGTYQQFPIILDLGNLKLGHIYLVVRDVAGEDLEQPAEDRRYLAYFERADAVLFMFDPSAVSEVRELLKDYLPTQLNEVGNPDRVLENMLRLIGSKPVPIGMVLSKFDTMQSLSSVEDAHWRPIMSNAGAAFTRDPGIYRVTYDRDDSDLLHQEVRSLLHLLHAERFVNSLSAPGALRNHRYFTVSALGEAANGEELHASGIAPYRCLDPIRWALNAQGAI